MESWLLMHKIVIVLEKEKDRDFAQKCEFNLERRKYSKEEEEMMRRSKKMMRKKVCLLRRLHQPTK